MSHDQDVELDAVVAAAVRAELAARYHRNRLQLDLWQANLAEGGYTVPPWQHALLQRQLDAQALRLTGGLVAV